MKGKRTISVRRLLKLVRYKPKFVGNDFDGCVVVQFRDWKGFSASIEFGTVELSSGAQDFYFEVLDLRGYREMDFIPLDSNMRKRVVHADLTERSMEHLADFVNSSLSLMYSGKIQ